MKKTKYEDELYMHSLTYVRQNDVITQSGLNCYLFVNYSYAGIMIERMKKEAPDDIKAKLKDVLVSIRG